MAEQYSLVLCQRSAAADKIQQMPLMGSGADVLTAR